MQSSISSIKMGLFNKIAMRFREPFWAQDCDMIEQVSDNHDLVIQFVNWYKYTKEPILIACIAAGTARLWECESNQEQEARISALLRKFFGNSASHPLSSYVTRWGQDEFSMGAYSVVKPGATAREFDALAEPVKRLFFAGEATGRTHQGTVHGAYLSGLRAAKQISELSIKPRALTSTV